MQDPKHTSSNAWDLVLANIPRLMSNIFINSHGLSNMCDHFSCRSSISIMTGHKVDTVQAIHTVAIYILNFNYSEADYDRFYNI